MKFYSINNPKPLQSEVNTLPSRTLPDMSLSLKEIINRYRLGTLPVDFVRSVLYDESDDWDSVIANNLAEYDLVDKQAELNKLRQKFDAMRSRSNESETPSLSQPARGMAENHESDEQTELAE